jgi:hypothetical protein
VLYGQERERLGSKVPRFSEREREREREREGRFGRVLGLELNPNLKRKKTFLKLINAEIK